MLKNEQTIISLQPIIIIIIITEEELQHQYACKGNMLINSHRLCPGSNERGEPAVSYSWTGWSSRLQENYWSFLEEFIEYTTPI